MTRPLPERLHPLSPLFLTLSYLWNLWPLLLYPLADLFFLGQGARLISLLILGGSLLVCLIPALLHYTHFRFRLEDEQIVLTSGFFSSASAKSIWRAAAPAPSPRAGSTY